MYKLLSTVAEIVSAVQVLLDPDVATPVAPEINILQHILKGVIAEGQDCYMVYDPEGDLPVPDGFNSFIGGTQEQVIAGWSGEEQGFMGYGDVTLIPSKCGPVVAMSLAGSVLSSASTIYIIPVGLLGWISDQD